MALSTSSRFSGLAITFGLGENLYQVEYTTTDDDHRTIRFAGGYPASGTDHLSDLEILQDIYASEDGFLDADGAAFEVNAQLPHGSTLETLEANGYPNPLIEGSYQRWETQNKIRGGLQADGSFQRDSETGLPTIDFEGVVSVSGRNRNADTFDAALDAWVISFTSVEYIRLTLNIPSTDDISENELDNYTHMKAMLAWLEDKRTAGSAVGSDASDPNTILGGTRRYTFAQASGDANIVTRHFVGYVGTNSDDNVTYVILDLRRESGAAIDTAKLEALLESATISLANTDTDIEDGAIGGHETVLQGKSIDLGDVKVKPNHSGIFVEKTDMAGNKIVTPILRPATVNMNTLDDLSGSTTTKVVPRIWDFDTVHYDNASTKSIVRIPNPGVLIAHQGTHRTIAFHNVNTDGDEMIIEDWNGNDLLEIGNGERAEFQVTLEGSGNGGKLILLPESIAERRSRIRFTTTNAQSTNRNFDGTNVAVWNEKSPDNGVRFRSIPYSANNRTNSDSATFTLPTAVTPVGGQTSDFRSLDSIAWDKSLIINHDGRLRITGVVEFQFHTSVSGGLTGLNGIRYMLSTESDDALTDTRGIGDYLTGAWSGAGTVQAYYPNAEKRDVKAGDVLFPIFIYYNSDLTAADEHILVKHIDLKIDFEPTIDINWAA